MSNVRIVYTTWPDAEIAASAGQSLVRERLAACVHIMPGGLSYYWWRGKLEGETETLMYLKTSVQRQEALKIRLAELHPYDNPAILAWSPDERGSSADYIDWINLETDI